ncbi:MAG: hypothetical protein IKR85_07925 [Clostridia bacterium]|nr:hypothetical protein [Clostridia bacterium]
MDSRKELINKTLLLAAAETVCALIMTGVFALAGRLDASVWLGALAGVILACADYFVMALYAYTASDKAVRGDVSGGKRVMTASYIGRLAVLFGVLFVLVKSGRVNAIAAIVPLALMRFILTGIEFFKKKGGAQ